MNASPDVLEVLLKMTPESSGVVTSFSSNECFLGPGRRRGAQDWLGNYDAGFIHACNHVGIACHRIHSQRDTRKRVGTRVEVL